MKILDWENSRNGYGCKVVDNPIHQLSPADGMEDDISGFYTAKTCLGEDLSFTRSDSLYEGWGWDRVIQEGRRLYYRCCNGRTDITDIVFFDEEWKEGVDPKEHYRNDPFHKMYYENKKDHFRNIFTDLEQLKKVV